MIKYKTDLKNLKLEVLGHADYAEHGYDIVCAGVSTLIISSTNLLIKLGEEKNIKYQVSEGNYYLEIKNKNKINEKIFLNIIDHLKDLEQQYPKNIKEEMK